MSGAVVGRVPAGVLVAAEVCAEVLEALRTAVRAGYYPSPRLTAVIEAVGLEARAGVVARQRSPLPSLPETVATPDDPASRSEYLSVVGAADRLGLSERRVRQLLCSGQLAGRQVEPRNRWEVERESLNRFLERGNVERNGSAHRGQ